MSNVVTLIEPDNTRVSFNEATGTITFFDTADEQYVAISAASWPAIAKAVSEALRANRNSGST